jgi:HlyD family secretion protein
MKRWKILVAVILSGALIATNLYLIMKEDSKVSRSIFVKDWTTVKNETITETFKTKGVTTSAEEYKVYFNGEDQAFQRFLVKEGDEVTTGTPLYEYTMKNVEQQIGDLERELAELEGEITGVTDYIQKLTDYKEQVPSASTVSDVLTDDATLDDNASSDIIVSTLEQEIYKQELEKSKLEEKKTKLDSQLTALNEQRGSLTFDSEVDGVVRNIDDKLGSPVMTIASSQQAIEGVLSESQYRNAKMGMAVKVKSPYLEKTMNGTIAHIESYPTKEPSLNNESFFPFQVIMESTESAEGETEEQPLVIGSKVGVTVITNEAIDVPTVSEKIVHNKQKPYVYKLTNKGYVNKEYVSTGLWADQKVELMDGPGVGEFVLVSPQKIPKNHSTFITPIQTEKVVFSAYDAFTTREKWRYFLVGMLEK